ncbi:MAG: TolC family protein, partial [Deltaproteobacteria bacterium]|nr:TolC family protein [Deltaproteobacteria bacterium]
MRRPRVAASGKRKVAVFLVTAVFLLAAMGVAGPGAATAEVMAPPTGKGLTLSQCITMALARNPGLQVSRRQIDLRQQELQQRYSLFLPRLDLDSQVKRYDEENLPAYDYHERYLTLRQELFRGGGNLAAYRQARDQVLRSRQLYRVDELEVVRKIKTEMALSYGFWQQRFQADAFLKRARIHLEAARKRHQVGYAAYPDVLKAKATYAEGRYLLEEADNRFQQSKAAIAVLLGEEPQNAFTIDFGAFNHYYTSSPLPGLAIEELYRRALATRPELQELALSQGINLEARNEVRAEFLPRLDLFAQAGQHGEHVDDTRDYLAGGLNMSMNFFAGGESWYRLRSHDYEDQRLRARRRELELQIKQEVWQALLNCRSTTRQCQMTADYRDAARNDLQAVEKKYQHGLASPFFPGEGGWRFWPGSGMKRQLAAILVVLFCLAGSAGDGRAWRPGSDASGREAIKTVRPEIGPIRETFLATGIVRPKVGAEVKVGSRVSGLVEKLYVKVGDRVKQGDPIAQIENRDLQARVAQAEAALGARRAELARIERVVPLQIAQQRQALTAARARFELASLRVARLRPLQQDDFVPKDEFDNARRNYQVYQAELAAARKQLRYLQEKFAVDRQVARERVKEA